MQDLNDLYYFVQVVDHGGFASAARAIGEPKSKLSRRIARLEDQLGARLIQRTSRQFAVTDLGAEYYGHCRAMLIEAEAAQAVIDSAASGPRGLIRLACPPGLVAYQMAGLIADFMDRYPEVRVQLDSTTRRVDVVAEGFDLAIRVREPPLEETDLVMRKLDESIHRLVAAPQLVERQGAPLGPADLGTWPSLDFGPARESHQWTLRGPEGRTATVRHYPRLVTDDLNMLQGTVRAGLGAALLPTMAVFEDLQSGRLVDLLPAWRPRPWIVHAVYPSRRGLLPSIRLLLDHLVAGCSAQRLRLAPEGSPP
jgi:DNA-binding transcriptional LysR family regulator